MKINPDQVLSQIAGLIQRVIGFGLLVVLGGAVLQKGGLYIPHVPTIGATQLVCLCGAWWLLSK